MPARFFVDGPAGPLEAMLDAVPEGQPERGLGLVCHPHPLHGGTMDNKVAQTLARAFAQAGYRTLRFNFRGVGGSAGAWDEGRGETQDALAALASQRREGEPVLLGGFSFGGFVAAQLAQHLADRGEAAPQMVLAGPAAGSFPLPPVPSHTLVVHGEADEVIPLGAVLDWARPQTLPVVVLPGVGHFFHGQLLRLRELVGQHLRAAQAAH
jgi:alpha/beta superfamily hydrolase